MTAAVERGPARNPSWRKAFRHDGWSERLARTCFPVAPDGLSSWGVVFVVVMAATLSCVRGGFDLGATTLWAEDGTVFVQGAYEHGLSAFITPYVGYLHLVPRLIAAVSTQLPLAAQAAAMALAAALAVARWVVQRRRATFAVAAAGLLGVAAQMLTMAQSTRQLSSGLHPRALTGGFLRRVVADGVLGTGRHVPGTPSTSIMAGAVLVLLVCGLVALLVRQRGLDQAVVPALLVVAAGATFVIPVTLTSLAGVDPFSGGRYYVAPALLFLTALVLLSADALIGRVPIRRSTPSRTDIIASLLLGAQVMGLVTSFRPVTTYGREQVPPWTTELDLAARQCAGRSGDAPVSTPLPPPRGAVTLLCGGAGQ